MNEIDISDQEIDLDTAIQTFQLVETFEEYKEGLLEVLKASTKTSDHNASRKRVIKIKLNGVAVPICVSKTRPTTTINMPPQIGILGSNLSIILPPNGESAPKATENAKNICPVSKGSKCRTFCK